MKSFIVAAIIACASPCFGTPYTASVSGNWNNAATWGGAGVPGHGDTAVINNGVTVTCPVGVTCTIGAYPADDTSTAALACPSASGTGVFLNYGTFVYQGSVRQCNANWVMEAGSTVTYDASGASTPSSALYTWTVSQANLSSNAILTMAGTSGSHVTVNSVGNYQSGGFGSNGTTYTDGGNAAVTYTDFHNCGQANSTGSCWKFRSTTAAGSVSITHSTFDNSGMAAYTLNTIAATSNFAFNYNLVTNPVNTSGYAIQVDASATPTTGTRSFHNNVITGYVFLVGVANTQTGFPFASNVFLNSYTSGQSLFQITNGALAQTFDQNLAFIPGVDTKQIVIPPTASGNITSLYVFRHWDPKPVGGNPHPIFLKPKAVNITVTGSVNEYDGTDSDGDFYEISNDATVAGTLFRLTHSLFLPNALGYAPGSWINVDPGGTVTNLVVQADHNTGAASLGTQSATGNVYGVGCEGTPPTTMPVGGVAAIQDNILFGIGTASPGYIAQATANCTVPNGMVTAADHNDAWDISTSIYGTPSNMFATTPGTGDKAADPQFVDPTYSRNLFSWDTLYLGNPLAAAWSSGTTYSVGQEVSSSDSSFHFGATYNYVCVSAHTASSTTKPGVGSAWAETWYPASLFDIENSVLAGQTFNGGTQSAIGALVSWVQAGYAPQNSAVHGTAHDGSDMGAVAYKAKGGLLFLF